MSRSRLLPYLVALGLAGLALSYSSGRGGDGDRSAAPARGTVAQARVSRVVDGDTIIVDLQGDRERVRYIGIDTPESVKPDTPVECFAKAASAANARLVSGRTVRLQFDRERRDRFGRLLAYVTRAGDGLDVNATLLRDGFARTVVFPPNTLHADQFAALERTARSRGIGLWGACPRR